MPYQTFDAFCAGFDAKLLKQLAGDGTTLDTAAINKALNDATAEIDGYLPRLLEKHKPSAPTLAIHCERIARYNLSLVRPGKLFESFRTPYIDTIAFYTDAIKSAELGAGAPLGAAAEAPDPVFNGRSLKGFVE